MPYAYRKRWKRTWPRKQYNFWKRRRRFQFRRRRPKTTIRRRKRFWVRKNKFFKKTKKRKTLILKQWQPELIRNTKIKGLFTVFACSQGRGSNNFIQFRDSFTPEFQPGGGGWSIIVFNLGAFFQEFERLKNVWTVSNINLPLVRYLYCKLKLYRSDNVDYVVHYNRNFPMSDNEYKHADACPLRMLSRRHKVIVASRQNNNKKPYVSLKIKPPRQLINKWFFQRDLTNTNLLMLTVTAISLNRIYMPIKATSNNISLLSLNYKKFRSLNFQRQHTAEPYQPTTGTYFYTIETHNLSNNENPLKLVKYGQLTFLGQCTRMYEGVSFKNSNKSTWTEYVNSTNSEQWGNVFFDEILHKEGITLLQSNLQPSGLKDAVGATKDTLINENQFTIVTEPIFIHCRYNPDIDTGKNTRVYLVPNFQNYNDWKLPDNDQLIFHGFPLWMLLWGWIDWQKKLALVNQIDQHYIVIIESSAIEPKLDKYMFLDEEFVNNTKEFLDTSHETADNKPFLTDQQNWYPKFWYQQKSINKICMAGPATHKWKNNESIEAHIKYMFAFKWGGSSSTMESIADPSKQPRYPTPDNITERFQIENPATDPRDYLYPWDFRRHILTRKATERLTEKREPDELFSTFTDLWNPNPYNHEEKDPLQAFLETQTQKKDKEQKVQQLKLLQQQQRLLQQRINQFLIQNTKL